jgi:multicomponent Na+:H+ antiporter subunit G
MIDVLAAVAVVISGVLAALAGLALLRFPDAITRLHASAKSATIGLIAAALAAALEVDTIGAGALLILVAALLFLSAPIASSLLARAAYHDAETVLFLPGRDDLATAPINAEPTSPDERPGKASLLIGWLFIVWLALFASPSAGVLIGALAVGIGVSLALPGFRPRWPLGLLRPVAMVRFFAVLIRSLVLANITVARAVIDRRPLQPAIVRIPLRVTTRTETTLLANAVTFTPGSVAIELSGRDLFVHVLDLRDEAALRADIERLETSIIAAFGTRRERSMLNSNGDGLRPDRRTEGP